MFQLRTAREGIRVDNLISLVPEDERNFRQAQTQAQRDLRDNKLDKD